MMGPSFASPKNSSSHPDSLLYLSSAMHPDAPESSSPSRPLSWPLLRRYPSLRCPPRTTLMSRTRSTRTHQRTYSQTSGSQTTLLPSLFTMRDNWATTSSRTTFPLAPQGSMICMFHFNVSCRDLGSIPSDPRYLHLGFKAPERLCRKARVRAVWAIMRMRHPLLASKVSMHDYDDVRFSCVFRSSFLRP